MLRFSLSFLRGSGTMQAARQELLQSANHSGEGKNGVLQNKLQSTTAVAAAAIVESALYPPENDMTNVIEPDSAPL